MRHRGGVVLGERGRLRQQHRVDPGLRGPGAAHALNLHAAQRKRSAPLAVVAVYCAPMSCPSRRCRRRRGGRRRAGRRLADRDPAGDGRRDRAAARGAARCRATRCRRTSSAATAWSARSPRPACWTRCWPPAPHRSCVEYFALDDGAGRSRAAAGPGRARLLPVGTTDRPGRDPGPARGRARRRRPARTAGGRVGPPRATGSAAWSTTSGAEHLARVVVGADGRRSTVARLVDAADVERRARRTGDVLPVRARLAAAARRRRPSVLVGGQRVRLRLPERRGTGLRRAERDRRGVRGLRARIHVALLRGRLRARTASIGAGDGRRGLVGRRSPACRRTRSCVRPPAPAGRWSATPGPGRTRGRARHGHRRAAGRGVRVGVPADSGASSRRTPQPGTRRPWTATVSRRARTEPAHDAGLTRRAATRAGLPLPVLGRQAHRAGSVAGGDGGRFVREEHPVGHVPALREVPQRARAVQPAVDPRPAVAARAPRGCR